MKLYSMAPSDSSGKVRWFLNEIGQEAEEVHLSHRAGDLSKPEYLAKHPLGQVPFFEDGKITLFESNAIILYLADKHADRGYSHTQFPFIKRGEFYQWFFFANSAETFFTKHFELAKLNTEARAHAEPYVRTKVARALDALETRFAALEYVLDTGFSVVDILMAYALDIVIDDTLMDQYPRVRAYYKRVASRPACVKSEIFKRESER